MIGNIYIIRSKQTDKVYIGSTFNTLSIRLSGHKCSKTCTSREILKYSDAEIELLECYECEDDEQLELREAYYIREYKKNNLCVNKQIPGRTIAEYKKENKETIAEYYQENKEKRKEYQKEHYEENKKAISEKKKEYYEENKEAINKKNNEYYEKNKEKAHQKFTCRCGGRYTHQNKAIHFKTKKHQDYFKD